MKLNARFIQLPLQFDADLLAHEIAGFDAEAWLPHPQGFAGNDFLPLVAARGEPMNESFAGEMAPTPHLERCPYIVDVLSALGASIGRTRLMRLSGAAEVTPHVDINYYWRDRMRVHVPILTQPTVRFNCGGQQINMGPGECWIFDTWSRHSVINDAERSRVHLVVDTVGGAGFWELAANARAPGAPAPPHWSARAVAPSGADLRALDYERENAAVVMTPWEVASHIDFLLSQAAPDSPGAAQVAQLCARFKHVWRGLWSTYGVREQGWPHYREALDAFAAQMRVAGAARIGLQNGANFELALSLLVIAPALADGTRDTNAGEPRYEVGGEPRLESPPRAPAALTLPREPDPRFERPVFIVNPPRSGSSLLFETLAQAPGLHTVGGESHAVIEGVESLSIAARNLESNALAAEDATPETVAALRARFDALLRDREGRPAPAGRVRLLEKTPKNALRVAFLVKAFPEARFIYLHRDPREVLASMMEAWESGKFRTYANLPGWRGPLPWSLLLTPGWRDLAALPLNQIVAAQWAAATGALLDSLEALPGERWVAARYDALLADPNAEVRRLCAAMDLAWDRELAGALPLARHTVSKPQPDKWRAREAEIAAVLPGIAPLIERASRAAGR